MYLLTYNRSNQILINMNFTFTREVLITVSKI